MSDRKIKPRSFFLIVALALVFSTVQIQGASADANKILACKVMSAGIKGINTALLAIKAQAAKAQAAKVYDTAKVYADAIAVLKAQYDAAAKAYADAGCDSGFSAKRTPKQTPKQTPKVTTTPKVLKPEPISLKSVSNGCGSGKASTNPRFLDTATFRSGLKFYEVNFRQACNVHDAGYSGVLVHDPFHGGEWINFSTWSRWELDQLFLRNLKQICNKQLSNAPTSVLNKCYKRANKYHAGVRKLGKRYFDANPIIPGTTDTRQRRNKD